MEIENLLEITTREELRSWLEENHEKHKFCWVIVSIKPEENKLLYMDAVYEALCFGWIDGIKKKNKEGALVQRLSLRTSKSNWTELNKERLRSLKRLNLLSKQGEIDLAQLELTPFEINPIIENKLKENPTIYENFMNFPEIYRRIRIDTIQSQINDEELFNKRLDKLLEYTLKNKMYGKWNDDGRLC